MNWTGGALFRHSGTSSSLKNRQKQHFAKVQARLRSGPKKTSPLKWPLFDQANEGSTKSVRYSSRNHAILGQERSAEPEARKSSSYFEPQQVKQPSPVVIKREPSNISEDLYNATPPPRKSKQQREPSVSEFEIEHHQQDSVAEKRQRILQKGDWVGIGYQKPLKVKFTSPTEAERVGKRRKTSEGHRAVYSKRKPQFASPLMPTRNQPILGPYPGNPQHQRLGPQRNDVRISIGGRHVQPGISSSSRGSKFRDPSKHSNVSNKSHGTSLDVMLLDGEELLRPPAEMQDIRYSHTKPTTRDYQIERYREFADGYGELQSTNLPFLWTQTGVQQPDISRSRGVDYSDTACSPRGPIFSSSSYASLQQPTPITCQIPQVLRSNSSDIADSTAARVCPPRPKVPSSQVLANDIWESWMADLCADSQQGNNDGTDAEGQRMGDEPSISPGISAATVVHRAVRPRLRDLNKLASSLRQSRHERERPNVSMKIANCPVREAQLPNLRNHRVTQQVSTSEHLHRSITGTHPSVNEPLPEKLRGPHRKTDIPARGPIPIKTRSPSDTDHLWRRFVFGNSTNEGNESRQGIESSLQVILPSDSSNILFATSQAAHAVCHSAPDRWFGDIVTENCSGLAENNSSMRFGMSSEHSTHGALRTEQPHEERFEKSESLHPFEGSPRKVESTIESVSVEVNLSIESRDSVSTTSWFSSPQPKEKIFPTGSTPRNRGMAIFGTSGIKQGPLHIDSEVENGQDTSLPMKQRDRDVYSIIGSEETEEAEAGDGSSYRLILG